MLDEFIMHLKTKKNEHFNSILLQFNTPVWLNGYMTQIHVYQVYWSKQHFVRLYSILQFILSWLKRHYDIKARTKLCHMLLYIIMIPVNPNSESILYFCSDWVWPQLQFCSPPKNIRKSTRWSNANSVPPATLRRPSNWSTSRMDWKKRSDWLSCMARRLLSV